MENTSGNKSDKSILDKIIDYSYSKEQTEFSPEELADFLLSFLPGREAEVVKMRYGFDGQKPKTLEAIGKKMSLTRERVRQIEKQALKNIFKHQQFEDAIKPFKHTIYFFIKKAGGLISEDMVYENFLEKVNQKQGGAQRVKFLLKHFTDDFKRLQHKHFKKSFQHNELPLEVLEELIIKLEDYFKNKKTVLTEQDLLKRIKKEEQYQEKINNILSHIDEKEAELEEAILSYLEANQKFSRTPLGQWGLSEWKDVTPKRINGKIYLILLHYGKPLHFSDIAEKINTYWGSARDVQVATVHNELIFDPRFVLVGRGMYGLKEWGYVDGSVEDVILSILKKKGAMSEKELIQEVKDKKIVKETTIKLVLKHSPKIIKNSNNQYQIK